VSVTREILYALSDQFDIKVELVRRSYSGYTVVIPEFDGDFTVAAADYRDTAVNQALNALPNIVAARQRNADGDANKR